MRRLVLPLILVAGLLAVPAASSAAPNGPTLSGSGLFIVQFQPNVNAASQASVARGLGFSIERQFEKAINGFAARLNEAQAKALQNNPNVKSVEPDYLVQASATQSGSTLAWGLDRIDQTSTTLDKKFTYPDSAGSGVDVYVFDTGLTPYSEFGTNASRVKTGFNAIGDSRGTTDCNGHGTHVSGTIASSTYGVAKSANIVPVRVLGCTGSGTTVQLLTAIDWVIKTHPNSASGNDFGSTAYSVKAVANMSLGFGAVVQSVNSAVENLARDGVLLAAAAGNDGVLASSSSPGSTPIALTVGATDSSDNKPSWSNYGSRVDLFAPGVNIPSLDYKTGGTKILSGTSMASPHVAGVAAVFLGLASETSNNYEAVKALGDRVVAAASTVASVSTWGEGSPSQLLYLPSTPTSDALAGTDTSTASTPGPTTILSASSASKGKATITWTPLSGLTSQTLYLYSVSGSAPSALLNTYNLSTTTSSATIGGLASGGKYMFGVSGNNSFGAGVISLTGVVTILSR